MSKGYESEEGEITHEDDIEIDQTHTRIDLDVASRDPNGLQELSVSDKEQITGIHRGDVEEGEVLTDDDDANNSDVSQTQKYGLTPITHSVGKTIPYKSRTPPPSCFDISHTDSNLGKPIQKSTDDNSQAAILQTTKYSVEDEQTSVYGNQKKIKRDESKQNDRKRSLSPTFNENTKRYKPSNATFDVFEDNFLDKQCRESSTIELNTRLTHENLIRSETQTSSIGRHYPKRTSNDDSSLREDSLPGSSSFHESSPPRDDKRSRGSQLQLDGIWSRDSLHVFDNKRSQKSPRERTDKEHGIASWKSNWTQEIPRHNTCTPGDSRYPENRDVHADDRAVKSKPPLNYKISQTNNSETSFLNTRKRKRRVSAREESSYGKWCRPNSNTSARRTQNQGQIKHSDSFKFKNGSGYAQAPRMSKKRYPTYSLKTELEDLAKKGLNEIVLEIAKDDASLHRFIHEATRNEHAYGLLIKLLQKALSCVILPTLVLKIIKYMEKEDILRKLIERIEQSPNNPITDSSDQKESIKSIIEIANRIFEKTPSLVVYIAATKSQLGTIIDTDAFEGETEVKEMFTELSRNVTECLKRKRAKPEYQDNKTDADVDDDIETFREITIFPQQEEILKATPPILKPNKAKGSYDNLNHYLDTQFRLLREDFIGPFREGITRYVGQCCSTSKLQDIRMYEGVQIILPVCTNGLSYEVSFEAKKMKVRWELSQRLMFGSLVCLSSDNFSTCFFATVIDSKSKSKGKVTLKFNNDFKTINSLMGQRFVMAESAAYFEAFKHVLASLQNIQTGQLPFENHIVKCETKVLPPKYLRDKPGTVFDLRSLLEEDTLLFERSYFKNPGEFVAPDGHTNFTESSNHLKEVHILKKDWPKEDLLQLDKSQLKAVKTALTKEFSIIQGPPGCGKTYIGLKIVKVLLNNNYIWGERKLGRGNPLVVLCYTNHALDQFMEGIASFYKGDIVRVGSRSSSEIMNKCSLATIRDQFRKAKAIPQFIFDSKKSSKWMFNEKKKTLYKITEQMKIIKENIIHASELIDEMGLYYKQFLWYKSSPIYGMNHQDYWYSFLGRSVIVQWLRIPEMIKKIQDEISRQGISYISDKTIMDDNVTNRDKSDDKDNKIFEQDKDLKEEIQAFKAKTVALNIDSIYSRPGNINTERWKTIRWERLELADTLNSFLKKTDNLPNEHDHADIFNEQFSLDQRWSLYNYWVNSKCQKKMAEQVEVFDELNQEYEQSTETLAMEDKYILKKANVIGLTTSGAAKNQAILKEIQPKILIVEEAAEVFESHIVSNLTSSCEQLILIGDHKQLRPKPTFYPLERDYNMGISLFERMIRNRFEYDCLETQHRMRPVIADNVRSIYPSLTDNANVQLYENIKGVGHNLYFINHGEAELNDFEMKGKSNAHEASFITSLCHYFLQQGYKAEELTVLTTYKKQMQDLRRILKTKTSRFDLTSVKVTVVDNYQGEENDIILLSLVRSNKKDLVGFLKEDNRVCVALSRAKKGLYVIANFDMLVKSTDLWKDIVSGVKRKGLLGPALPLKCQNHMDDPGIMASTAEDFLQAPEGGCRKLCDTRLDCGHVCEQYCHVIDREHKDIICQKPCTKLCRNSHKCRRKCFEECECLQWIKAPMPRCGHMEDVLCSADPSKHLCQRDMEQLMPECGHMVSFICEGRLVIFDCTMKCEQIMDCGHPCIKTCSSSGRSMHNIYTRTYYLNMSICPNGHVSTCTIKCNTPLACGHMCSGNCEKCLQSRIHKPCDEKCKYELLCGHKCPGTCSECKMCKERCERRCSHSQKCQNKCSEVCKPCTKPCEYRCQHFKCTKKCFEPCDRPRCNERCRKRKSCGHQCVGLCGDLCPMICPKCNVDVKYLGNKHIDDTCLVQLDDCGHFIQYDIMDQYMDKDEGVCLKRCPVCYKPIRESLRYKHIVNAILQQIEYEKIKAIKQKRTEEIIFMEKKEQLFTHDCVALPGSFDSLDGLIWYFDENRKLKTFFPRIPSKQFMLDIGREVCRYLDFLSIVDAFIIHDSTKAYTTTGQSADLKETLMSSKISLQEHNVYDADKRNKLRTTIRKVFKDLKSTYDFKRVTVCLKVLDALKEDTDGSASILIDFNETQHKKILPDEIISQINETLTESNKKYVLSGNETIEVTVAKDSKTFNKMLNNRFIDKNPDEKMHEQGTSVDNVNSQLLHLKANPSQDPLTKQTVACTTTISLPNLHEIECRNDMEPDKNQMPCMSNTEINSVDSPVHPAQEIHEQIVQGIIIAKSQFDVKMNSPEDIKQTLNTEEMDSVIANISNNLTGEEINKDNVDESWNTNNYTTSNNQESKALLSFSNISSCIDNPMPLTDHTKAEENNKNVLSGTVFNFTNIAMTTTHETNNNEQNQMISNGTVSSCIHLPKASNDESKNQEQTQMVANRTVSNYSDIVQASTENLNIQEQNEMMPSSTINCCIGIPLTLEVDIKNQKQNEVIPPSTSCNDVTMPSIDDSKNEEQNESDLVNSCNDNTTMDSTDDIKTQEQHKNVAAISVNSCVDTCMQEQTVENIKTIKTFPIYMSENSDNQTVSSDNTVCKDKNENENIINSSSSGAPLICLEDNKENNKANDDLNVTHCIDSQPETPDNVNQKIKIKVDDAVHFDEQTYITATEDNEDNEAMDISDVLKTHDLHINFYKLSGRPYFKCAMSSFKACVIESQDSSICDSSPSEVPQVTSNYTYARGANIPHKFELKTRKFSDKFEVPIAIPTRQHRDVEKHNSHDLQVDIKDDSRIVKISKDSHSITQSSNEGKIQSSRTFKRERSRSRHSDERTGSRHHDERTGSRHHEERTGSRHHEERTGSRQHDERTGSRHHEERTGSRHHDERTGSRHHDERTRSRHHDERTGSRHHDERTGSRHHDERTGSRHHDERTNSRHHDERTGSRHHDERTRSRNHEERTRSRHHGERTNSRHHDERTGSRHHDERTYSRHHNERTRSRHYEERTSRRQHEERTSSRHHDDGNANSPT